MFLLSSVRIAEFSFGKSILFGLLCVSFVKMYQFVSVCVSFPFCFQGEYGI